MLLELEDSIIERLKAKGIPASFWSGKPEELFLKPKTFPAVRVIIETADFEEMHFSNTYGAMVKVQPSCFLPLTQG